MEYRYHRMVDNDDGWKRPVPGRLGKSNDYLGHTGFGHEDWNFSREIWSDGKIHLYLKSTPAQADLSKQFSIVLGVRRNGGHYAVGFCKNAHYKVEGVTLGDAAKLKRAKQLHALDQLGQLGGHLKGLTAERMAGSFLNDGEAYWVAVDNENLIQLVEPLRIPADIVNPAYNRYGLVRLTEESFERLYRQVPNTVSDATDDEKLFPEGALVAKTHLTRERDSKLVKKAKDQFAKANGGKLFCEACKWSPDVAFESDDLRGLIIEAHHDVPLSSKDHGGKTDITDLRMLCPNCHRAIHRLRPWSKVDDFKKKFFPNK